MIGFFLDAEMTRPITSLSPKRFLAPTSGYQKYSTVYLGDPYISTVAVSALSGASSLELTDVSELLSSGLVVIDTMTISYTGISGTTLTGVSGISVGVNVGDIVYPLEQWDTNGPITIYPYGPDVLTLNISMRLSGTDGFTFPGMPLIVNQEDIQLNTPIAFSSTFAIDVMINVPPGSPQEFTNWDIQAGPFYLAIQETSPPLSSPPSESTYGVIAVMPGYVNRADQALPTPIRVLAQNRQVLPSPPGFIIGQYCWRDDTEINQQTIVPTNWETDPSAVGNQFFIAGIGQEDDLEPQGFVQVDDSIYLQINRGFYWTGAKGYYLPADQSLNAQDATVALFFAQGGVPTPTIPMFLGNYVLDSQGFYEWNQIYVYETQAAVNIGIDLPDYYFTWDPVTQVFSLSAPLPDVTLTLGPISGESTDYYNLPIYPVNNVQSVYVALPSGGKLPCNNWVYDPQLGTITITNGYPIGGGGGPSVPGSLQGELVVAICTPAIAVLFDTATNPVLTLDQIDLNPAFAGISGGVVYLQQSRQEVASITLACDKPIIPIPPTYDSIIGLVAYGPIYFNGDYALLQATAYSDVPGQTLQGVQMQVIADPDTFTGTINYLDPIEVPIIVTTGADGTANMVFRPAPGYGFWIPVYDEQSPPTSSPPYSPAPYTPAGGLSGLGSTNIPDDTLFLPQAIPISQLYDDLETQPFLVTTYVVLNNNPILGMVGANALAGQVAWVETGTPGLPDYKTNGQLQPFLNASDLLYPIEMLDIDGNNYTSVSFDGNVVALVYGQSLPIDSTVGAYFISFIQRTLLYMQALNSNVESNSILLQMQMPPFINDNVWLILNDAVQGILNQYRLGWTQPTV